MRDNMDENQSIAIIVPVYNMEKRLKICLDSILNQSYPHLEIVLIDDGSTDSSPQICDEYVNRDSRIRVIHQTNQGISAARNQGIKASKSDYLVFIDSDDYVGQHFVYNLAFSVRRTGTLLGACQFQKTSQSDLVQPLKLASVDTIQLVDSTTMLYKMLYHEDAEVSAWDKIYHRSLFNQIEFPEGEIYEDIRIMPDIVAEAGQIAIHPYADYFNFMSKNSIQRSSFNDKKMVLIHNIDRIYLEAKEKNNPMLLRAATYRYGDILIELMFQIEDDLFEKERLFMWNKFKELRSVVLKDKHPKARKVKIAALFSYVGYLVLKMMYGLQKRLKKQ